eukprot:XP_008178678.1 PREDICTED: urokinase-type plasminogen activator-like [Acyrthosiphon pisum]
MLSNQISIEDRLYKITVGKYDRNFTMINDEFTQIIDVEMIYKPKGYNVDSTAVRSDNIAVIILASKVSFSNGVVPACIDWNNKYTVQEGAQGKAFFWEQEGYCNITKNATQSLILLEKSLPYININDCREFYFKAEQMTYDKFCAGSKLGPRICPYHGNSGHGLIFLHSNSYFLTGIMSLINIHNNYTVHGFTDIKYHVQWIREILNKHLTMNSCVLPVIEGVLYSYEGFNDILPHGTLINHHLTVIENCEHGYHKAYPKAFRYCLGKGKWLSNSDQLCFKMCPPLESDSLDFKCSFNGKYANCSNLSIPDTIATPSCKATYIAPNGQEDTPLELRYCGRTYVKSEVLIENGEKALVGTAPWNVGIYRFNRKNSIHEIICGGTVIAPNLVISAAHCFWNIHMSSKIISIKDGLYKIAVGKYDRNFTIIDNEFTQILNIEMIYVHEGYYGSSSFYADDIAIIVLTNRLSFSNGVAPICIDWNDKYNVVNGDDGKVVGWGRTEKGIPSPILLEASLPYINHSTCRKMFTGGFERFVTIDKFCAGSSVVSGQSVGQGDSGAGLCFFHYDSYYLTGVVSVKDPDSNKYIAVFTEIKYHIQWIRGLYTRYN